MRGHNTRSMELLDLHCVELNNEGPSKCLAVVILLDNGKPNQSGRVETAGMIRSKNVLECPVFAMAAHLFYMYVTSATVPGVLASAQLLLPGSTCPPLHFPTSPRRSCGTTASSTQNPLQTLWCRSSTWATSRPSTSHTPKRASLRSMRRILVAARPRARPLSVGQAWRATQQPDDGTRPRCPRRILSRYRAAARGHARPRGLPQGRRWLLHPTCDREGAFCARRGGIPWRKSVESTFVESSFLIADRRLQARSSPGGRVPERSRHTRLPPTTRATRRGARTRYGSDPQPRPQLRAL